MMWEIPLYLIIAPLFTITVTLITTLNFKKYWLGPVIVFVTLNIPTIVIPLIASVGWSAIFGWSLFYTVLSIIVSLLVRWIKYNKVVKS